MLLRQFAEESPEVRLAREEQWARWQPETIATGDLRGDAKATFLLARQLDAMHPSDRALDEYRSVVFFAPRSSFAKEALANALAGRMLALRAEATTAYAKAYFMDEPSDRERIRAEAHEAGIEMRCYVGPSSLEQPPRPYVPELSR